MTIPGDVKVVLISGGFGGIGSWAFTAMGGSTYGLGLWAALPLSIILGAMAALVAVYIIVPADVSKIPRLIAFAALTGFLWKPVLDAGRIVITDRIEVNRVQTDVKKQVEQLKTAEPAAIPEKTHQAADAASALLRATDPLGNPAMNENAEEQAKEVVTTIAATSSADPESATIALRQISDAAIRAERPDVARFAAESIQRIQQTAPPLERTVPPNQ